MSDKFHLNPNTGNPSKCSAKKGNCPFAGDSEHFESMDQAREHFENENSEKSLESARKNPKIEKERPLPALADVETKNFVHSEPTKPVRTKPSIEAGLTHARGMVMSTGIKANNNSVSARDRETFEDRNRVAWNYRVALEHLSDTGKTSSEDFIRLAEDCDRRAAGAEKAAGWTPRARRRNVNQAQMYNYLAGTLRKLANGESVDDD